MQNLVQVNLIHCPVKCDRLTRENVAMLLLLFTPTTTYAWLYRYSNVKGVQRMQWPR